MCLCLDVYSYAPEYGVCVHVLFHVFMDICLYISMWTFMCMCAWCICLHVCICMFVLLPVEAGDIPVTETCNEDSAVVLRAASGILASEY